MDLGSWLLTLDGARRQRIETNPGGSISLLRAADSASTPHSSRRKSALAARKYCPRSERRMFGGVDRLVHCGDIRCHACRGFVVHPHTALMRALSFQPLLDRRPTPCRQPGASGKSESLPAIPGSRWTGPIVSQPGPQGRELAGLIHHHMVAGQRAASRRRCRRGRSSLDAGLKMRRCLGDFRPKAPNSGPR
jgi:hypothetical protein